tara:strand:- start:770 stop:904 length:135 start_codon:yes stop_codon:yes gene_type:complete
MIDWYINKMKKAHDEKRWDDRSNYAQMAKIDFVKYFYFRESDHD